MLCFWRVNFFLIDTVLHPTWSCPEGIRMFCWWDGSSLILSNITGAVSESSASTESPFSRVVIFQRHLSPEILNCNLKMKTICQGSFSIFEILWTDPRCFRVIIPYVTDPKRPQPSRAQPQRREKMRRILFNVSTFDTQMKKTPETGFKRDH